MEDLRQTLGPARRIVRDRGMELFCAGTHPFARWSTQKLTDAPRYAELIKRTQWWGRQMLIWGVHVHVGISSAAKVMPIMTSLLNYYPHCWRCRRRRRGGAARTPATPAIGR